MDAIETHSHATFLDYLGKYHNTICGRHPIGVLLAVYEILRICSKCLRVCLRLPHSFFILIVYWCVIRICRRWTSWRVGTGWTGLRTPTASRVWRYVSWTTSRARAARALTTPPWATRREFSLLSPLPPPPTRNEIAAHLTARTRDCPLIIFSETPSPSLPISRTR